MEMPMKKLMTATTPRNEPLVVLFRGAPGSGKTTAAKRMFPNHALIEADDYFMVGGQYLFDPGRVADAHKHCLWRAEAAAKAGIPFVVANTFSRYWEIKEYLRRWPNAPIYRCVGEWPNVHGVPADKVRAIRARMEPIFGEIVLRSVS
jgi:hypothetical protein